jgi:hypothetical protein
LIEAIVPRLVAPNQQYSLPLRIEDVEDPEWTACRLNPKLPQTDTRASDRTAKRKSEAHSTFCQGVHNRCDIILLPFFQAVPPLFEVIGVDDLHHTQKIGSN